MCLSNIFPLHQNLCEPSCVHKIQAILELPTLALVVVVCHNIEVIFFLVLASHQYSLDSHLIQCLLFQFPPHAKQASYVDSPLVQHQAYRADDSLNNTSG